MDNNQAFNNVDAYLELFWNSEVGLPLMSSLACHEIYEEIESLDTVEKQTRALRTWVQYVLRNAGDFHLNFDGHWVWG